METNAECLHLIKKPYFSHIFQEKPHENRRSKLNCRLPKKDVYNGMVKVHANKLATTPLYEHRLFFEGVSFFLWNTESIPEFLKILKHLQKPIRLPYKRLDLLTPLPLGYQL